MMNNKPGSGCKLLCAPPVPVLVTASGANDMRSVVVSNLVDKTAVGSGQ